MNDTLKVGDTIKCFDADNVADTMTELARQGVETDFLYELNGLKGLWLKVTGLGEETAMNKIYSTDDFTIEVITKGAFLDDDPGFMTRFLVETTVFRANPIALNEYLCSSVMNCRETYETEDEWKTYRETKKQNREAWEKKITEMLGIDTEICSLKITQSLSEIFTAVAIRRIPKTDIKEEE